MDEAPLTRLTDEEQEQLNGDDSDDEACDDGKHLHDELKKLITEPT